MTEVLDHGADPAKPTTDAPIETRTTPVEPPAPVYDPPPVERAAETKSAEVDPVHEKLDAMHTHFTDEIAALRTEFAAGLDAAKADMKAAIDRLHTVI